MNGKRTRYTRWFLILALLVFVIGVSWFSEHQKQKAQQTPGFETITRTVAYAGLPQNVSHVCRDIKTLENTGFTVGYCETLKNPVWVVYRLGLATTQGAKRPQRFVVDERTEARVSHDDYTGTGYDRGHMAPNHAIGTRYGENAQLQTFLMSNICPQKPNLNRQVWRLLEQQIADDYAERLETVWMVTGPIFGSQIEWLQSGVAIPEAFFKVVVDEQGNTIRTRAYIVPQEVEGSEPVDHFLTTVDEVERRTGLDLLWELNDAVESQVEKTKANQPW